jgi:hypothetical protein
MEPIKLDEKKLQELAEKYAMEGAEKAIKEFYTGYHSEYMKQVEKVCQDHMPSIYFDPVDITAEINKAIKQRMTAIANEAVANTFIPLIERMLTGTPNNLMTSGMLYQEYGDYVKEREDDDFDADGLEIKVETDEFFTKLIFGYDGNDEFRLYLSEAGYDQDGKEKLYITHSLPMDCNYKKEGSRKMTLHLGDRRRLEMPFEPDALNNSFVRSCARAVIYQTKISIDRYHEYHNEED